MVGDDPRADSGAVLAGIRTLLLPALASAHRQRRRCSARLSPGSAADCGSARLGLLRGMLQSRCQFA